MFGPVMVGKNRLSPPILSPRTLLPASTLGLSALLLAACTPTSGPVGTSSHGTSPSSDTNAPPAAARDSISSGPAAPLPAAQAQFFESIAKRCGQAFAGQLISDPAADADMAGKAMVMHIRRCTPDRIEIPFHVAGLGPDGGWDRSRTWVLTRTDAGLRLKHDHRHADGSHDDVTLYGGDTADNGTSQLQSFPVDAESTAMFKKHGMTASLTNIWDVRVDDSGFTYGLRRANRDFRVHFDFASPITPPPPAPWGW
jgi:hypothetical protein